MPATLPRQTALPLVPQVLREERPEAKFCVLWKANNEDPHRFAAASALNALTVPRMLDAVGVVDGVLDPGPVTRANVAASCLLYTSPSPRDS